MSITQADHESAASAATAAAASSLALSSLRCGVRALSSAFWLRLYTDARIVASAASILRVAWKSIAPTTTGAAM